ncbi:MAG: bifunctional phosphoglucose/phosphomannose isomerase [Candidatus Doudnabacteria bacterium]|nr:bifunctional phosphoglucose/phosphomannose isomerase [Candidatus Doudnabacteria bacterium]
MMRDAILNFPKQFRYQPKLEGGKVKKFKRFVVAGMGGSPLPGLLLKTLKPVLPVIIWRNYGLPELPEKDWKKTLVVAISYSGNTEEAIDALETAIQRNLPVVAVAIGGKLLELAKARQIPYVQLPDTGIQPRSALGFMLRALLKVTKENELFKQTKELAQILKPLELEPQGKDLAEKLRGKVPVIYSSDRNLSVAYNWKIKFNETGKIPAFYNILPELNHNEINGFDVHPVRSKSSEATAVSPTAERTSNAVKDSSRPPWEDFHFIFLQDSQDHPRIIKRMEVTAQIYRERGLPVESIELAGENQMQRIFSSLLVADWTAFHTAEIYGLESEQVPVVEELKKLIK